MKVLFAHVAESTIQAINGNLSIVNIFSVISTEVPNVFPRIVVVVGLEFDQIDGDGKVPQFSVVLRDPEARELRKVAGEFDLGDQALRKPQINLVLPFDGVLLSEHGDYVFEVCVGNVVVRELRVHVAKPPSRNGV